MPEITEIDTVGQALDWRSARGRYCSRDVSRPPNFPCACYRTVLSDRITTLDRCSTVARWSSRDIGNAKFAAAERTPVHRSIARRAAQEQARADGKGSEDAEVARVDELDNLATFADACDSVSVGVRDPGSAVTPGCEPVRFHL